MGDYNTWGGKNNRWGNRNRKNSTDRYSNNSGRYPRYEPNKLFNTLVAGALIFTVGAFGLDTLGNVIDTIGNGKETIEMISDTKEIMQNTKNNISDADSVGVSKAVNILEKKVVDNIGLSADNVAELLEDLSNTLYQNNIDPNNHGEVIVISYKDIPNQDYFNSNILENVEKSNETITYCIVCNSTIASESEAEIERLKGLVEGSISLLDQVNCSSVISNGIVNYPYASNFIYTMTFVKNS